MSDNKINRSGSSRPKPTICKLPADSVPYGRDMTHKDYVWAAYDGETLVAVAASSAEVRRKYLEAKRSKK